MVHQMIRRYSELIELKTFEERFEYLKLDGIVGVETFGFDRIFNQRFYTSGEWKRTKRDIIVRDLGCDLGCPDREIPEGMAIYIHHMNPINLSDLRNASEFVLDQEYLITTVLKTHNAIHFGSDPQVYEPITRRPYDTCPWKV